jgi:endonuclease/exonuclease/phosphatase (EEP) superfamily protein YafD
VLTCNVEGENAGPAALHRLIVKLQPDVVALQECPDWDQASLSRLFPEPWTVRRGGTLLVASRHAIVAPPETHLRNRPPSREPVVNGLYCVVESPQGRLGICSVHQRTPRPGLYIVLDGQTGLSAERGRAVTEETAARRMEAEDLVAWLQGRDVPTVVAGDLNMPIDSAIYRDCWSRFDNVFSQAGFGFGSTKVIRVHGVLYGLRIDHVLVDGPWKPRRAWVADSVGSDHLPLVAEVGR